MPEVDIIMPNYNKSQYIDEAIKSVLKQNFIDWKLYIIDDFSSDDSTQIINRYSDNTKIKIISLKKNKGPSFCRNLGMRMSTNDFIAFIDSDDYWEEYKLKNQINFMKKNNINFSYTDYIPFFQTSNKKKYLQETNIVEKLNFKSFCRNSSINTSTLILKRRFVKFIKFKNLKKLEDYVFKCDLLKISDAIKFKETSAYYRILRHGRSSNKLENIKNLWSVNKKFNNLNFFENLISVLSISYNSLKKYGFK
jgi:teichuronic acid biosynthesis glycosyltransferase TuaG